MSLYTCVEDEKTVTVTPQVNVNLRLRKHLLKTVDFYVGPTNSGKTYNSLNNLLTEYEANPYGTYVYAGPLRMLAYEVYEKMVARYGEDNVGFLTGEEQINPNAPLLACTVEMAPMEGTSLVLDETHWIVDHNRGQHWTNLLVGGAYKHLHILTAEEALPTIQKLVTDSESNAVHRFTRKTQLTYKGDINLYNVPNRTAVVCFSRKAVYAVARLLEEAGKNVGVLYGALPLKARASQIERYLNNEYDIMVTTDVIGHGINLPIDNVVFAQTEKFDGAEHRDIHTWEVAQIAGRAGRFGLSDEGSVYTLVGTDWFSKNTDLISKGTQAGAGTLATDLQVNQALITPSFNDLNVTKPEEIMFAVRDWMDEAECLLTDLPVSPSAMSDASALLVTISEWLGTPLMPDEGGDWKLTAKELWELITGPFDPQSDTIRMVADWLSERNPKESRTLERYFNTVIEALEFPVAHKVDTKGDQVLMFEQGIKAIGELKMVNIMFGHTGTLRYSELAEYEERFADTIINIIQRAITEGKYGLCVECRDACSPWFKFCEDCYWTKRY